MASSTLHEQARTLQRFSAKNRKSEKSKKCHRTAVFYSKSCVKSKLSFAVSRSSFWEFSKYEMLVKLKHIACWIEIPSFWLQALHSPQTFEMVWTKDEVDKYVVQVERNCKSAHEVSSVKHISFIAHRRNLFAFISIFTITFPELQRNLKGFAFARLYREASDNETAKR